MLILTEHTNLNYCKYLSLTVNMKISDFVMRYIIKCYCGMVVD
jgi:hypothetical protein